MYIHGKRKTETKTTTTTTINENKEKDCTLVMGKRMREKERWNKSSQIDKKHITQNIYISFFICVLFDRCTYCTVGRVRRFQPSFSDHRPSLLSSSSSSLHYNNDSLLPLLIFISMFRSHNRRNHSNDTKRAYVSSCVCVCERVYLYF